MRGCARRRTRAIGSTIIDDHVVTTAAVHIGIPHEGNVAAATLPPDPSALSLSSLALSLSLNVLVMEVLISARAVATCAN